MSGTLCLKAEIDAICVKAGLDPKSVRSLTLTPAVVTFDVYSEPKRVGPEGEALLYAVAYPVSYTAD